MSRDFNSAEYRRFRAAVKKRDHYRCRFPGCSVRTKIHVHHLKRVADFPELELNTENAVTLCKKHHQIVTGNEESYEAVLTRGINPRVTEQAILNLLVKYAKPK